MVDTSYFDAEMLSKETAELGRELQNLRLRITIELLVSSFVLIYAIGTVRMLWRGVGILPLVLNAVAWTYWGVAPFLRFLGSPRPEIDLTSDTNDEFRRLIFRFEIRTQRLRREAALARLVDLLIALQFVALTSLIVIPAF
jgi:hypothetical protein